MKKLDYGVNYTLENGYNNITEIDEVTKEGLENGFLDIYEVIDINWIIEENEFDNDICIDSWSIKKLKDKNIIYLD
ncbi:hypothetical protein [Clostridium sp. ZBS18]|uniref:hypothetical protein n=1 Tax=Clostridium sp. ZBS18 TaxID=2949967 RepID=UPI002079B416|nr:hypothetical protein [Clostridium sp. ZBS18]